MPCVAKEAKTTILHIKINNRHSIAYTIILKISLSSGKCLQLYGTKRLTIVINLKVNWR